MPAISVNNSVFNQLNKIVKETGLNQEYIATQAIEKYLAELEEDREDIATAEQVMAEIESGRMKTFPACEVYKELGL